MVYPGVIGLSEAQIENHIAQELPKAAMALLARRILRVKWRRNLPVAQSRDRVSHP